MERYLILLGTLCVLAGCGDFAGLGDPYMRPGTFALTAINQDNLRLMAVNPGDLQEGRGASVTSGYDSAAAVARLRSDSVKSLPDSALAKIGGTAGSGGQASGGGGAGASQ
jgi:hypothetical protein